jgi:hypothetical protein
MRGEERPDIISTSSSINAMADVERREAPSECWYVAGIHVSGCHDRLLEDTRNAPSIQFGHPTGRGEDA